MKKNVENGKKGWKWSEDHAKKRMKMVLWPHTHQTCVEVIFFLQYPLFLTLKIEKNGRNKKFNFWEKKKKKKKQIKFGNGKKIINMERKKKKKRKWKKNWSYDHPPPHTRKKKEIMKMWDRPHAGWKLSGVNL